MAYTVNWLVDKRVLMLKYHGVVTGENLANLNQELAQFLQEGEQPVHIISDDTSVEKNEAHLNDFRKNFAAMTKPGWGHIIIINASTFTKFIGGVMGSALRINLKILSDMDAAEDYLREKDATLPAFPTP